jgi:hypothetical protein
MINRVTKTLAVLGALGALAVGGSAIAGAATSSTTPAATTTTPSSSTPAPAATGPAHGTAAHENAETAVTGTAAAQAQAAAVKLVGSGTAGPVTTDMQGSGYETTVTKADGSTVEVHLDSSFAAFQGGRGHGAPGA